MEKNTNIIKVKCPHCGAEYTIDEIYLAQYITGKSKNVIKDAAGTILHVDYDLEPDLAELFTCEYCNKDFKVDLDIKTKTSAVDEEVDFSTNSASLI